MMVYITRDYWVFGFCPSSGVLLCFLEYRTRDKVHKPSNAEYCRHVCGSRIWSRYVPSVPSKCCKYLPDCTVSEAADCSVRCTPEN
jgi:hypothetical protein